MNDSRFDAIRHFVEDFGVAVVLKEMAIDTPGTFDGLTIEINPLYDRESASYYLAHSFGSIVQWSTRGDRARAIMNELRQSKRERFTAPPRFEAALSRYLEFEQTSSEHAVWLLGEAGQSQSIPAYTMFFRADLEAMAIFHRTGKAPSWPEFYDEWKRRVSEGAIIVHAFPPRPFGRFRPVRIEEQKVLQEHE